MPVIRLPSEHDASYAPARGPVLLLSCMDLRVLDEIVQFMDHDNLGNRYDHVVFAGAALGALGAPGAKPKEYPHWKTAFFDHLLAAVDLHQIQDVYILEHRNCGAYYKVFKVCPDFGDTPKELAAEAACHLKYANLLEQEIQAWAMPLGIKLRVAKFLMDLRGRVAPLVASTKPKRTKRKGT